MDKWEYQTRFLSAKVSKKETREFIKTLFGKKPKTFSPEALIPELNELGEQGWEVISMEPVPQVGRKEDIRFFGDNWTHTYFCVLKRRKAGTGTATPTAQTATPDNHFAAPIPLDEL